MPWIRADYEFGSLFSYRIPDYPSPSYALSSPFPGPSTIKLAIVATAIETSGNVDFGKKIFNVVKNAKIRIGLPKRIAISDLFIRRLKQKKDSKGLEKTFGIRGYVHFFEPLVIYLDLVENGKNIKELLFKIRRFGTSDSLVSCRNVTEEEPPKESIEPVDSLASSHRNVLVIPVKDLNQDPDIKFEHINPYRKSSRRKDVFVKKFYLLPISRQLEGKNWTIYEI